MHYYQLKVTDPEEHEQLNDLLSGPRATEEDKPPMMTEAAKAIPVPSWWRGGTTVSAAHLLADKLKEGRR